MKICLFQHGKACVNIRKTNWKPESYHKMLFHQARSPDQLLPGGVESGFNLPILRDLTQKLGLFGTETHITDAPPFHKCEAMKG